MKVLVTGAAGFIGSYVARALILRGDDVVGIDNFSDYYSRQAKEFNLDLTRVWAGDESVNTPANELDPVFKKFREFYGWDNQNRGGKFQFHEVDIRDYDALESVFNKHRFDAVIHLAAMAGVELSVTEPRLYTEVNINGSVNLLELMQKSGVKKYVFGSSSSIYGSRRLVPFRESDDVGTPASPYAATKYMMERFNYTYHLLYGIKIINARIFGPVYGPLQRPHRMVAQRFINKAWHNEPMPIFGNGNDGGRDSTYIDDEVDGLIRCLDSDIDFDTFNIGSGRVVTPIEVAKKVQKLTGKGEIEYLQRHASEVFITFADTQKAKDALGYEAMWDFEDGLARQIEIYKLMPDWYKDLPS